MSDIKELLQKAAAHLRSATGVNDYPLSIKLDAAAESLEADAEAVQRQREDLKDKDALVEISDIPLLLESAAQRIAIGDWVFAGKLMKAAELLQTELTTLEDV